MGSVVELHPDVVHREREREFTHAVGMMAALGSWAMMFAAFLMVYLGMRSHAVAWPPPGLSMPLALPAVNTVVIVASSFTLHSALRHMRAGRGDAGTRWTGATFGLGLLFVLLQVVLWQGMWSQGITTSTGALGTVFYVLTALHAVHVAGGLVVLGYLLALALRKRPLQRRATTLRLCGMYWHFVDAVWLIMFLSLFVF